MFSIRGVLIRSAYTIGGIVFGGLVGILIVKQYIELETKANSELVAAPLGDEQAVVIPSEVGNSRECGFDSNSAVIGDYRSLVGEFDPAVGPVDAKVIVVEYFDPNCPHCKSFHPVLQEVISRWGLQVRFVFKPIPIWPFSVHQVAALYSAYQQRRYDALLDAQYAYQRRGGLSLEMLLELAEQVGMDREKLRKELESGFWNDYIRWQFDTAVQAGVKSVPTVLINGRFVSSWSRTAACLDPLIMNVLKQF